MVPPAAEEPKAAADEGRGSTLDALRAFLDGFSYVPPVGYVDLVDLCRRVRAWVNAAKFECEIEVSRRDDDAIVCEIFVDGSYGPIISRVYEVHPATTTASATDAPGSGS